MISRRPKKIFFAALWLFVITQAYIMGYVYHRIAHADIDLEISGQIAKAFSASGKLGPHSISLSSIESGDYRRFIWFHPNALQSRIEEMIYFFERTDYEGLTPRSCALAHEIQAYYQHKSFSNPVLPLEGDAHSASSDSGESADIVWESLHKKNTVLLEKREAYVLADLEELIRHCVDMKAYNDSVDNQ